MKKTQLLIFFMLLRVMLPAQDKGLILDGVNDYVNCGTGFDGNAIRTMECWVKFNSLGRDQEILSRSSFRRGIELLLYDNGLCVYCMNTISNYSFISYPISKLTTGLWYHIAFTWNGTKESMKLYVNDKLVGVRSDFGDINITGVANVDTLKIGNWSDPITRFLDASVDNIRIWNTTRTSSEIKAGIYGTVANNAAGLLAVYNCDEGAGVTIANSSTSTAVIPGSDGTLKNGTAWLDPSPVHKNENGIYFDGVNDYVTAPANPAYDFTTGSIECWIRPDNLTGNACILGNRQNATCRYSFHISSSAIGMYDGETYITIPYTTTPGQWYHLAFVCGPTNTAVYVNGGFIGTINNIPSSSTGLPLQIGIAETSELIEPFSGIIDEVRIWDVAITQEQIEANMNLSLTGNEEHLVGLFGFNQGIAAGNNTGLRTAVEGTTTNNHGTLTNFALNGNTSNWVAHTLNSPLALTGLSFAAVKKGAAVELNWSTISESNTRSFDVEKSADGRNFIAIGTVKAAGQANQKSLYSFEDGQPLHSINYYRLKQVDLDGNTKLSSILIIKWQDELKTRITITPQPWHSIASVGVTGAAFNGWFTIYDVYGKKIKNYPVKEGSSSFMVNRNGMPAGQYFYRLATGKGEVKNSGTIVVD